MSETNPVGQAAPVEILAQWEGPAIHEPGVRCEACHGGAERWIKSHAQRDATHAANLALGMYPTETPARRAQLCLSCHIK